LAHSGEGIGVANSMVVARECRIDFFTDLERRGENAIFKALDTLNAHIFWILVQGGEASLSSGGNRLLQTLTGQTGVSDSSLFLFCLSKGYISVTPKTHVHSFLFFSFLGPICRLRW
jgi:hypothetical protein